MSSLLVAVYLIFWESPAPVVSVSMSLVLRGAKKLGVFIALVGSLPAADFGAD
jgi:hypothetical protein